MSYCTMMFGMAVTVKWWWSENSVRIEAAVAISHDERGTNVGTESASISEVLYMAF